MNEDIVLDDKDSQRIMDVEIYLRENNLLALSNFEQLKKKIHIMDKYICDWYETMEQDKKLSKVNSKPRQIFSNESEIITAITVLFLNNKIDEQTYRELMKEENVNMEDVNIK